MSSLTCLLNLASKFDKGSSNNNTFGLSTIALATATLCCCPPDNSEGILFSYPSKLTSFKVSKAFSVYSSLFTLIIFRP